MTLREQLERLVRDVIYMGRHFSKHRDDIVVKKSVDYIELLTARKIRIRYKGKIHDIRLR